MIHGIIEILLDDANFVSKVGNGPGNTGKVYWVIAPQDAKIPYVILTTTGNNPNQNKDAPSTYDSPTFSAFVYAESPEQCDQIDVALRLAVEVKNVQTETIYFYRVYMINQADGYDREAQKVFRETSYGVLLKRPDIT